MKLLHHSFVLWWGYTSSLFCLVMIHIAPCNVLVVINCRIHVHIDGNQKICERALLKDVLPSNAGVFHLMEQTSLCIIVHYIVAIFWNFEPVWLRQMFFCKFSENSFLFWLEPSMITLWYLKYKVLEWLCIRSFMLLWALISIRVQVLWRLNIAIIIIGSCNLN
jgi:hypothetical protein